jgi:transcriptional regulator with XRE-family HTH domain
MRDDKSLQLGKKIRETLTSYNMSIKELSESTGIQLQTLYSIINGHHQVSLEKLRLISKVLHLSIDALLDIDVNTFPMYSTPEGAPLTYAKFENLWLGPNGGERISVSRNLSVVNQSIALREEFLAKIYGMPPKQVHEALSGFKKRKEVIRKKEKTRLEIAVYSELVDYITQQPPFDLLTPSLVRESIESVIDRLEHDALNYEVIIIPRQHFLVNYEILNREVILFDLGSVFFRQTHPSILNHFLAEVENVKFKLATITDRKAVINFFKDQLHAAQRQ